MPIAITCPSCSSKFKAPDHAAGRKVKCPKCGTAVGVPELESLDDAPPPPEVERPVVRRKPDDEDDLEESGAAPRRTRRNVVIAAVVIVTLLVAGVVVLVTRKPADGELVRNDPPTTPPPVPSVKGNTGPEKPPTPVETPAPKDPPTPPVKEEVIRLTADNLSAEFEGDKEATDKRYRGRVLEVTGVVDAVGKDVVSEPGKTHTCLYLARARGAQVSCTLSSAAGANALKGKSVTVRGTYDNILGPALVACSVLSSAEPPNPPKRPEAQETERAKLLAALEQKRAAALDPLEKEYRANAAEFEKLKEEEAVLKKNPRFGDPFNKQLTAQHNALVQKQLDLARKVQETQAKLETLGTEYERDRRRILVKYPEPGDPKFVEYEGFLLTKEEVAERELFKKDHGTPRAAAEKLMKAVETRGTVRRPAYAGLYQDPKQKDAAAVAFGVTVNGRSQAVHVFVYKKGEYWFASNLPGGEENNLFLGSPPSGFKKVQDGPAGEKDPFDRR